MLRCCPLTQAPQAQEQDQTQMVLQVLAPSRRVPFVRALLRWVVAAVEASDLDYLTVHLLAG